MTKGLEHVLWKRLRNRLVQPGEEMTLGGGAGTLQQPSPTCREVNEKMEPCTTSCEVRVGPALSRRLETSQGPFPPEQPYLVTLPTNVGIL